MFIYPWGDSHSLNLGWFLVQFKTWTEKIQEYLDNGGGTAENLANVIAPVFNAENSYLTGDYVLYNDELYKALEPVPAGTWTPDAWQHCLVTEEMGSSATGIDNVARLMIAGQYSNTYNYQKYAICRHNDKLWMCNTNLPAGGEEWVPSHWDEITVGAGLTGLRRSVDTLLQAINTVTEAIDDETEARQNADRELENTIDSLGSDDIRNDSTNVSGTTVTAALNNLKSALSSLETAINHLSSDYNSGWAEGFASRNTTYTTDANIYWRTKGKFAYLGGWFVVGASVPRFSEIATNVPKADINVGFLGYDANTNDVFQLMILLNTEYMRTQHDITDRAGHTINIIGVCYPFKNN